MPPPGAAPTCVPPARLNRTGLPGGSGPLPANGTEALPVLDPIDPGVVLDGGPPAGDAAIDLCTPPALDPLSPILAVRLYEDGGDGMGG